jgi:hypothetical protein
MEDVSSFIEGFDSESGYKGPACEVEVDVVMRETYNGDEGGETLGELNTMPGFIHFPREDGEDRAKSHKTLGTYV